MVVMYWTEYMTLTLTLTLTLTMTYNGSTGQLYCTCTVYNVPLQCTMYLYRSAKNPENMQRTRFSEQEPLAEFGPLLSVYLTTA